MAVAAVATLLVSGCMTVRVVDSEVRAFTVAPSVAAGSAYRFERLPSQLANDRQTRIEGIVEAALNRVGLRRDDQGARYSVQIGEGLMLDNSARWRDPWRNRGWWGSVHAGSGGSGVGIGFPLYPYPEPSQYVREVGLTIRDLAQSRVVYETRAVHDGPGAQSDEVLPPMFEAALRDFPNPPQGPRRINIDLPRVP
jgi:hypothetical protein